MIDRIKSLIIEEKDEYFFAQFITMIVATIVVTAATAFCTYMLVFRVAPKFDDKNIELGNNINDNYSYYLYGAPFMHKETVVDTSSVDIYTRGDYTVSVSRGDDVYEYVIHVVDTTAPEILISDEADKISIELGVLYTPSQIIEGVNDASGMWSTYLYRDGVLLAEDSNYTERASGYSFGESGSVSLEIKVRDEAGNESFAHLETEIRDTLPPVITPIEKLPYYAVGREYYAYDFVEKISDLSGFYSVAFLIDGEPSSSLAVNDCGRHDVTIYAVDEAGNESTLLVTPMFDEAPVFVAARDYHLFTGSDYDFTKNIVAVDSVDGNLTEYISISGDDFDRTIPGIYEVNYSVSDKYGLTSCLSQIITIGDEENTDFTLSPDEIDCLFDYDYFMYGPLERADYEKSISLVEPSLVNLMYRFGNGGHIAGSGFIYQIDKDYIYIVTCHHVLKGMKGDVEVMFCDKEASVLTIPQPEYITMSDESEIAMFRIPVSMVDANILLHIRQIFTDENVYDELTKGEEVVSYSGHWLNEDPLINKMNYRKDEQYFLPDCQHCIETTHNVVGGMSGTATFDEKGRLIGVVEGYKSAWDEDAYDYQTFSYHIMINGIHDLYERVSLLESDAAA